MMLTVGSFVSPVLPRRLSLITMFRLLTTFTKNVLNTSATSLLRESVSSFWVLFYYDYSNFCLLQKALQFFKIFQCLDFQRNFLFLSKKTDTVTPLLFICTFVRLSFIFQKFLTQPRTCHHCFLKCLIHKWALICPYVTDFYRSMNIKDFF